MSSKPQPSTDPPSILAALFDLDDTLIDRRASFGRLAAHRFDTLPPERRAEHRERFIAQVMEWCSPDTDTAEIYRRMMGAWNGCFLSLEEALDWHEETMPKMAAMSARTRQMLLRLQSGRVPVGVVTNGPKQMQRDKVESAGIDKLVNGVTISSEFGIWKPDPAIFVHTLSIIGADASRTLFVGDNPESDIGGARSAGMMTAWIRHGRTWNIESYRPDWILDEVWQAEELIEFPRTASG